MITSNILLLLSESLLYFGVMTALLHGRNRYGLGIFVCALGVMHFLETYLAAVFYIQLPFGIISPGSTVLFSGKLMMILLLYIKEDALVVRQPIYGLLIGNFLLVGLIMIARNHETLHAMPGRQPDMQFVDEMGSLMIWGTALLFLDSIAVILLYERLGRFFAKARIVRIFVASALTLTFDQLGFFAALHAISGTPMSALLGGWVAKIAAAVVYSCMIEAYLRWFDLDKGHGAAMNVRGVFESLTYRERYERLLEESGRDSLTGALDRRSLDADGPQLFARAKKEGTTFSLIAIDLDDFKSINDTYGHQTGDWVLQSAAHKMMAHMRIGDPFYRYGGEEFIGLCQGLSAEGASAMAERLRVAVEAAPHQNVQSVTVSIGVANYPGDGDSFDQLFGRADERLYRAKRSGKNRVVVG
ncbi:GGDEF domain-containing protein [Phyllobacterium zundukense]|uniref:diguanylate cyclase n=1 Tax=Phyllobacterium zundukense TaxID=1867719 RepID=A0A2N9VW07_9HYPH|nr:GGDEF domain-containing protein [Phyllobacterium zundukense]ATU91407.1 GGDEF domain-containing protein [Phyllobacterium zundukense]PIO43675.1 GGDEF domain-containing protein [Phyllobacterium zundukense]